MSLEQTVKYGNYKSMVYNVRYERICKQKNSMAFLKSFIKGQTPKWLRRKISITVISKNSISICDSKNSDNHYDSKNLLKTLKDDWYDWLNDNNFCCHTYLLIQRAEFCNQTPPIFKNERHLLFKNIKIQNHMANFKTPVSFPPSVWMS